MRPFARPAFRIEDAALRCKRLYQASVRWLIAAFCAAASGKSVRLIRSRVKPPQRKIFCFRFTEIYGSLCASRPRQRGASRSSRTLRVGCGGRQGVQRVSRGRRHPDGRRNRVVPIPRRWDQALCDEREATAANKPGTPRRARISRKTIAQGTPDCLGCPVVACVRKSAFLCTQGPRVRPASGVPCALVFEGG